MKNEQKIELRIQRHKDFWKKKNDSPLIGYSPGNYFVSRRFKAVEHLLTLKRYVTVDDFNVDIFLHDFDNTFEGSLDEGADLVYSACPFTGLPWMEALYGCKIIPCENSFITQPVAGAKFNEEIKIADYSWKDKYFEFIDFINKYGKGRYPAGQPILRGPGDVLAAIFESKELICCFYEYPGHAKQRINEVSEVFLNFVKKGLERFNTFYGGYSLGFYPIWCPGKALWFQDDITALLSPEIYDEFFFDIHRKQANACEYSMIHLHPDSFYIIERLLTINALKAIEINKDIGGPSVYEMLPFLQQVQAKKNLVLWGDFTDDEIRLLTGKLNAEGLFIIVHRDKISDLNQPE
jgi:hypothetical protein